MNIKVSLAVAAAVVLTVSGCQRSVGQLDTRQPTPLAPAPVGGVQSSQLPPTTPTAPTNPSQFPDAPTQPDAQASLQQETELAANAPEVTRESLLGPLDRVLGFGFGALKGAIIVVVGFSLLVLGYDTVWGEQGRPTWIHNARTYASINAGSEALVGYIQERRAGLRQDSAEDGEGAQPVTGSSATG